jgi:hypothetical protein
VSPLFVNKRSSFGKDWFFPLQDFKRVFDVEEVEAMGKGGGDYLSCHVMSCHFMSFHVMSCHVMTNHGMSCHYGMTSFHVMSLHVISCRPVVESDGDVLRQRESEGRRRIVNRQLSMGNGYGAGGQWMSMGRRAADVK